MNAPVRAPRLPTDAVWSNTARPVQVGEGVLLLDFWTYCCVNCWHSLEVLRRLRERFRGRPFEVVGVHAPKFDAEARPDNLRRALDRLGVEHPVLLDADHSLRREYAVSAWPTLVLVDAAGYVRRVRAGEAEEEELVAAIEELLAETTTGSTPRTSQLPPTRRSTCLRFPTGLAADERHVFVADSGHHRVLVCDRSGRVLHAVGGSRGRGFEDGRHDTCAFDDPRALSSDGRNLFVTDRGNHALRSIELDLLWTRTLAGDGRPGRGTEPVDPDQPLRASLRSPFGLVDLDTHLVLSMAGSHQLWLHEKATGRTGPWAGTGAEGHVDGPLREAVFAQPSGLALAGPWVFVADAETSSVRAVDVSDGEVRTLVGHGLFDFGDVDGTAEEVRLQHPEALAVLDDVVYVADTYNHKIKAIDLRSLDCRTIFGDGDPTTLCEPAGLCVLDRALLVADTGNHRLLRVDPRTTRAEELPIRAEC